MIKFLVLFIIGMFCSLHLMIGGVVILLILSVVGRLMAHSSRYYVLAACVVLLGFMRGDGLQAVKTLPASLLDHPVIMTGVVANIPQYKNTHIQFYFEVKLKKHPRQSNKILLKWYACPVKLLASDQWQLKVKLKSIGQLLNSTGFNYRKWLLQHGVTAVGYVIKSTDNKKIKWVGDYKLTRWRQSMQNIIADDVSHRALAAIIAALTVGSRALMSSYEWSIFQATGTSHLVAISGLHVGLVAMIGYFVFGGLWRCSQRALCYLPAQKVAAIGALLAALIYCTMAGFAYPTQRALIMIALILWLQLYNRFTPLLRRLWIAFLLIIIMEPIAVYAAGFWLSFAAVASICYGCSGRWGASGQLRQHIAMQKTLLLGLSTLTLGFFQQLSLIAPLANLVAVPWVTLVIVPVALLACMAQCVRPILGEHLFHLTAYLLSPLWELLKYLGHFHWAVWQQVIAFGLLFWWGLGIYIILLPAGFPGRWLGLVYLLPLVSHVIQKIV